MCGVREGGGVYLPGMPDKTHKTRGNLSDVLQAQSGRMDPSQVQDKIWDGATTGRVAVPRDGAGVSQKSEVQECVEHNGVFIPTL